MAEQSVQDVESMAKRSLMVGTASLVLLLGPWLLWIYANRYFPNRDLSTGFRFVMLAVCLFFGSLILSIIGLVMSLRILRKIKRQDHTHIVNRTLIVSLVLNGLVVAFILIYLVLGVFFSFIPPTPPRVVISPSPPIQ